MKARNAARPVRSSVKDWVELKIAIGAARF
jgi:hypothetical protein